MSGADLWLWTFINLLFELYRAEQQQQDATISKLMKDVDTYKDLLQKTESRLSKKIKDLSSQNKSLVKYLGHLFIVNTNVRLLDRRKG